MLTTQVYFSDDPLAASIDDRLVADMHPVRAEVIERFAAHHLIVLPDQ